MATKFSELRAKMSPAAQALAVEETRALMLECERQKLLEARGGPEIDMAEKTRGALATQVMVTISAKESDLRRKSLDYARGCVSLEGVVIGPEIELIDERFISGELTRQQHIEAIKAAVLRDTSCRELFSDGKMSDGGQDCIEDAI